MSATTEPKRRRKRRPGWAMKPGTDELKVWMTQEDRLATFWLMRQLNQPSPQALVKHLIRAMVTAQMIEKELAENAAKTAESTGAAAPAGEAADAPGAGTESAGDAAPI